MVAVEQKVAVITGASRGIGVALVRAYQDRNYRIVAAARSIAPTVNQVRLVLHTAAFWLMHGVRAAIPNTSPLANGEFATIRERLIKIGARVIEHIARIRVQLPTSCPEAALFELSRSVS